MATINDTAAVILANAAGRSDLRVLPLPRGLKVSGAAANRVLEKLVRTRLLASVAATREDVVWGEDEQSGRTTLVVTEVGLAAIGIETEGAAEPPSMRGTAAALRPEADSSTTTSIKPTLKARVAIPKARPAQKGAARTSLTKGPTRAPGRRRKSFEPAEKAATRPFKPAAKSDKSTAIAAKPGTSAATTGKSGERATKSAARAPSTHTATKGLTKQQLVVGMLRRANGASIDELVKATGWQPHSVRGVLTATVKGRLGLPVISEKGEDGVRRYFVAPIQTGKGTSS